MIFKLYQKVNEAVLHYRWDLRKKGYFHIEFKQISGSDCGDFPRAIYWQLSEAQMNDPNYLDILNENIKLIETYDWEMIRITGSKYYSDIYPNQTKKINKPEQFFRQYLSAIKNK